MRKLHATTAQASLVLLLVCPGVAMASVETVSYAIVIGNNAPPVDNPELPTLRYADDDAVRYYQFFRRINAKTTLLTVLDAPTQKRYPKIAGQSEPPTVDSLLKVVQSYSAQMAADRGLDKQVVLYVAFSGHGAFDNKRQAFLAFLDKGLTQQLLFSSVLEVMPTTYSHLIIDACHASAVVGVRGMFDRELEATPVEVSPGEAKNVARSALARLPGLGVIMATTADQEAHEWSRFEAGVFTHELLSGLSGPADVNGDGVIEYTEIQAYVAAANRDVSDPRAAVRVVAHPPRRNQNAALITLRDFGNTALLEGDMSSAGHFYIELENGQRYLDANLADLSHTRLMLPAGTMAFVRTQEQEAILRTTEVHRFEQLNFVQRATESRGSLDQQYRRGLFASPYGATYYKGFVDSIGAVAVQFPPASAPTQPSPDISWYAVSLWGGAGLAGAVAIASGAMALGAYGDYQSTDLQRPAADANTRVIIFSNTTLALVVVAVAAGIGGALLWLEEQEP